MKWARHPRTRFLLAFIAVVAAVALLVVRLSRVSRGRIKQPIDVVSPPTPTTSLEAQSRSQSAADTPAAVVESPSLSESPAPSESPIAGPIRGVSPSPAPTIIGVKPALIIPVAGVRPDQLRDTFDEARSEGRVHDAIDIPAPHGTPVLAAADGKIVKLFQSERGGATIYQISADQRFFYYYAHLDRYADGLAEGQMLKQGSTIAYVGDTGNAGPGNYHLHFSISLVVDPKRWWEGVNLNPYPLLKR